MELLVDIRKNLGRFQLDVDFSCGRETLAILGGSGSGKSMTLKCIAGIETPDEGQIILNGQTLFDSRRRINLTPQARRTGLMFQSYALFPNLTVAENITICLGNRNRSQTSAQLSDLLRRFQLEELASAHPAHLSGGQQQRVALARIFALQPEILMLDEPFSALDSYLKWQMELDMMDVLAEFARPALFVSHNRDEVYRISDRIAIMKNGQIESINDKHELFRQPLTLQAATLTGCKNFSRARKLGWDRIWAEDWGIELIVTSPVPDQLSQVGIRAHSFRLPKSSGEPNLVPVRIQRLIQNPFSTLVIAQCCAGHSGRDLEPVPGALHSLLRWEIPAPQLADVDLSPGSELSLAIAPDQLLLLA